MKQDYSYSVDANSCLVAAKDAVKGNEYYCPCCGSIMILKHGNIRRPHFAHKCNLKLCSYETYLHKVAKKRICECFNQSSVFTIMFHSKAVCAIKECPVGKFQPCNWKKTREFNLREYYDQCKEEVFVDKYKADLLITNSKKEISPVLIEIYVSHKSTEDKLNSKYRIIELHIESEDDIDQIVQNKLIQESSGYVDKWNEKPDEKIKFYNFKADSIEEPDEKHQSSKFRFWIDSKKYFHLDYLDDYDYSVKCLTKNTLGIENSIFLIESGQPIDLNFAFYKLIESGLNIKYCKMGKFYKMNDYLMKSMCILYKSKGTKKYPMLSDATNCPYFKQNSYINRNLDYGQEYKIIIQKDKI